MLFRSRADASPYAILIDDVEHSDGGKEHDFGLSLHTHPANKLTISGISASLIAPKARLDIHLGMPKPMAMKETKFGPYPSLQLSQKSPRLLSVMLLHPRRENEAKAEFQARQEGDGMEATVRIGSVTHKYRFDIAKRPNITAGDERIIVKRLA